MFHASTWLRLLAMCAVVAIFAAGLSTVPAEEPKGKNKNMTKGGGPIPAAIKGLQAAEKSLEEKKFTPATEATHAAEAIVKDLATQAKQPEKQGGDQDRAKALEGVLKDIKDAKGQIASRKVDEASKAIKSAISALEGLAPPEGKRPEAKKPEAKKKD